MKLFHFIAVFLLAVLPAVQGMAQVRLPLDASNCAIFNALNPGHSLYCAQATDLGQTRGLIVRMNDLESTPEVQLSVAELPTSGNITAPAKRPATSKIDYKAAKSETGYYIHFAFDSETLENEYRDHLDRLAIVLNSPSMKENCVKITGHTDTVGKAQYNIGLSRRRAKSVYNYLSNLDQVDKTRFTVAAAGESQPLPDKAGASPFNRRVEFSSKSVSTGCKPNS